MATPFFHARQPNQGSEITYLSLPCYPVMHKILLSFLILISGCAYTVKVTDGDTAMDRYQFDRAIAYYEKDLDRARSRVQKGRTALKLAECHSRKNDPERALPYYEMAWNNQAGVAALRGKAYSLKMMERYDEAIETFEQLGEEIGSRYEFRRDIQSCSLAIAWKKQASGLEAESLPVNSAASDYAAAFLPGGIIAFSSDRGALAKDKDRYLWTGKVFSDILTTDSAGQLVGKLPEDLLTLVNSPAHEGSLVMDPSGEHLFFTRCGGNETHEDQFCRIYGSSKENGTWRTPEPLPFCTGTFNYGHAWPSADGRVLVFSSDDPQGIGGYDLYSVERTESGWSAPMLLPLTINTPGDEMFPVLDGEFLYFASDHHPGMGGLDIFRTRRTGPRSWTVPENMMPPINSGADDFAFVPAREPSAGNVAGRGPAWFSSSRPGGKGGDDLYELRKQPPILIVDPGPTGKPETSFYLDVFVLTRIYLDPEDPNSTQLGRKAIEGATLRISGSKDTVMQTMSEEPASLRIQPGQVFEVTATATGYLNALARFDARDISSDIRVPEQRFELEIVLEKPFVNREVVLENIYYDYDRWEIRPDAEPSLDRLASLLLSNPTILIELASHTDCRGTAGYNQELSQRRAQSAVDYLIGKGVEARRLRPAGYGESKPANSCACSQCTEAEHQQNRRTSFRILED